MKSMPSLLVTATVVAMGFLGRVILQHGPSLSSMDPSKMIGWLDYNLRIRIADACFSVARAVTPLDRRALGFQNLYWEVTLLQGLVEHRLFDEIDGKRDCASVATHLSLHVDFTCRFMRGGASMGLLERVPEKPSDGSSLHHSVYKVTPLGAYFQYSHPETVADLYQTLNIFHSSMGATAMHSLKTGRSGVREAMGMGLFEYLSIPEHDREATLFDNAMNEISNKVAKALIADWYPDPTFRNDVLMCDIGGGKGTIIAALCSKYPHLKGMIMEQHGSAQRAVDYVNASGLSERINIVEGDFFADGLPEEVADCDVFYLKAIFHDWGDEDCVKIINNIRKVSRKPKAKIVGHDILLGLASTTSRLEQERVQSDLTMMAMCEGGRERTVDEYFSLFAQAGLDSSPRLFPLRGLSSIVEVDF